MIDRSPASQRHLSNVYQNIAVTIGFGALAIYLMSQGYIMEPGIIALLMFFGCMLVAQLLPDTPQNSPIRHGALYGFGFSQGWIAGPLVDSVLSVDPQTVLMATVAATLIFGSFSMSALYSPRRQYMYLGGLLGTVISVLAVGGLANIFIGSSAWDNIELYLGLFIFSFFVLYDTQIVVERAESGRRDPVRNALLLYTDFAAVFIRLLIVLRNNYESSNNNNNRRRKRN